MPSNIVKSFAKKTGKTEQEVERLWNKAKEIADNEGHHEDYSYIVGILKKMLGLNKIDEKLSYYNSFKEYIKEYL